MIFSISALLAGALYSVVARPTASPTISLPPYTWSGEIYHGSKPVYFTFAKPKNAPTQTIHGYISQYGVLTEHDTQFPIAFVSVVEDGTTDAKEIDIGLPLRINGSIYECNAGKSKSRFEQRYHVCPALPKGVMGPEHPVTLRVFKAQYPDGSPAMVTSEIDY